MYNLVSSVSEVLLVLFQGYSLQWFYGQFMETRYGRWKNSRYLIMILWVVMRLTMSYLWQMDYDDVRIQGKLFVTIALLVLMTMWLYVASYGMKLYLSITFLAINEISWVWRCSWQVREQKRREMNSAVIFWRWRKPLTHWSFSFGQGTPWQIRY